MALTNEQLRKLIARRKAIEKKNNLKSNNFINKNVIHQQNYFCSKMLDRKKLKAPKDIPKSLMESFWGSNFNLSDYKIYDKDFGFIYTKKAKEPILFDTSSGTIKMSFIEFDSLDDDVRTALINSCNRKKYGNDYIEFDNINHFYEDVTNKNIKQEKELIKYIFQKLEVSNKFLSQSNAVLDDLNVPGSVKSSEQLYNSVSGAAFNADMAHSALQKAVYASRILMPKDNKK